MKTRYYKITGMDEGVEITPFGITLDELDASLTCHGDAVRYHEEITRDEYVALVLTIASISSQDSERKVI